MLKSIRHNIMKKLIVLIFCAALTGKAQSTKEFVVSATSTNVLTANETNFFQVNSNLLNASISPPIAGAPLNGTNVWTGTNTYSDSVIFGTPLEQSYYPAGTFTTFLPTKAGDYGWAIYGDYRNGVSGERYVSGFGVGDPGFHTTGGVLLNGENGIQLIPAASQAMMAIGMDVTQGIVIYGGAAGGNTNNTALEIYGDAYTSGDVPTNSTYPSGKTNLVIDVNGDITSQWGTASVSNLTTTGLITAGTGGITLGGVNHTSWPSSGSAGDALTNMYNHAHATPTLTIYSGAGSAVSYNSTIGVQYASDQAIIGVLTNGPSAGTNTQYFQFFSGTFGTNYSTPPLVELFSYYGIANSGGLSISASRLSQSVTVCNSSTSGWTVASSGVAGSGALVANATYGFEILIQPTSP